MGTLVKSQEGLFGPTVFPSFLCPSAPDLVPTRDKVHYGMQLCLHAKLEWLFDSSSTFCMASWAKGGPQHPQTIMPLFTPNWRLQIPLGPCEQQECPVHFPFSRSWLSGLGLPDCEWHLILRGCRAATNTPLVSLPPALELGRTYRLGRRH